MIPVPAFKTVCGQGVGMAACSMLKVLVTASHKDLTVFALPDSLVVATGFARVRTIRGDGCVQPLNFKFREYGWSGWMAFTGAAAATRLLVVTDSGNSAVHVINVVHGTHVGYVAAPGSIASPRGVAARGMKVAVSAFVSGADGHVHVYEGSGTTWTPERIIGPLMNRYGLRFTDDGKELAVVAKSCVSLFRVNDGAFVRYLVTDLGCPIDMEKCAEYGWAVADWQADAITFVGGTSSQASFGAPGSGYGIILSQPSTVAFVPGLGLVVRELGYGGRLQLFATPDAVAMAAMSAMRTTWMATVLRWARARKE